MTVADCDGTCRRLTPEPSLCAGQNGVVHDAEHRKKNSLTCMFPDRESQTPREIPTVGG